MSAEIEIEAILEKIKDLLNGENYRTMSVGCNIDFYINQLKELRDKATEREKLIAASAVVFLISSWTSCSSSVRKL